MSSPTRSLLALALVSVAAATGCGEWKTLIDDALERAKGGDKGGATGPVGSAGAAGSGDASLTCDAVTNADGTVCKRCIDASGVVVREDCSPSATGGGGTTGAGGTGAPTGGPCIKVEDGGPTSCKDAATWKKYGTERCAQQNLVLSDIAYGAACGANFETVTYVCCGGATGAGGSSGAEITCDAYTNPAGAVCKRCVDASGVVISDDCPTPPPPTGGTCTKINDGGPTSCKDAATWKNYGGATCARLGLALTDVAYGTVCGANFQDVVYVCCGTPAPGCSVNIDALGNTCNTCRDAAGVVTHSVCKASGVTCEESAGANGALCKTCKYPDGRIYSAECHGGTTGGTEICDVRTSADGTVCKVCYQPDGSTISSCP